MSANKSLLSASKDRADMSPVSARSPSPLSDGTTSFILSDGGTRRVKYADLVSLKFDQRMQWTHFDVSFLGDVSNEIRAEKVPSWWNKWVYFLTDCRDAWIRYDFLCLRCSVERYNPRHPADSAWRHYFLLHRHAACQSFKSHQVQQVRRLRAETVRQSLQNDHVNFEPCMPHGLHNFVYRLHQVDVARDIAFVLDGGRASQLHRQRYLGPSLLGNAVLICHALPHESAKIYQCSPLYKFLWRTLLRLPKSGSILRLLLWLKYGCWPE